MWAGMTRPEKYFVPCWPETKRAGLFGGRAGRPTLIVLGSRLVVHSGEHAPPTRSRTRKMLGYYLPARESLVAPGLHIRDDKRVMLSKFAEAVLGEHLELT